LFTKSVNVEFNVIGIQQPPASNTTCFAIISPLPHCPFGHTPL
jgi:hypothetical protein